MDIDILSFECFLAVTETGSFTKAADKVNRTQSALSQQILKLENVLGKKLFFRGKNFNLTPEGEIFLSYARQICSLQAELITRFKEPELSGEVRFGLPENFASIYLSEVLAKFTQLHPRILLNIECDLTLNLYERFKEKEFDIVLVKMNRPEDFPNGLEVWSEPLRWVGDESLIRKQKTIPLVLSPKPCVYRTAAIKALEKEGFSWRLVFTSPSFASTIAAVKAGMGVTIMPHTMIPKELKALKSGVLPKLSDTHVSLLKHTPNNPAINSLEEFVLQKFNR